MDEKQIYNFFVSIDFYPVNIKINDVIVRCHSIFDYRILTCNDGNKYLKIYSPVGAFKMAINIKDIKKIERFQNEL